MAFDYKKFNKPNDIFNYDWFHCTNEKLLTELRAVDSLFSCIVSKILKCPHCDGYFFYETDDSEYSHDGWWMCNKSWEKHVPSKARLKMIEEIVCGYNDDYWNYSLFDQIEQFELIDFESREKKRKFSVAEWEKETGGNWGKLVEELINEHIKYTIKGIEESRKYRLLKTIFKQKNFV